MATQILIAHTGQRHEVDASQFSSIDELKAWVGRNTSVPTQHVIALTPQGRSVKSASVHNEREIYIYDVRTTQPSPSGGAPSVVSELPLPSRYNVPNAPNSISDVQAISSWQELYKERRTWALRLLEDCQEMHTAVRSRYDEIDVMIHCVDAAVTNLEISIKQIEPKREELMKWVEPALTEHASLVESWQQYLNLARNTPIAAHMVKFMTRGQVNKGNPTLEDLIEMDTAKKAGKLAPTAHRRFSDKAKELDKINKRMYDGLGKVLADLEDLTNRSVLGHSGDSAELLQDLEAVAKQIDSDYRTALGYSNSQRDIAFASKTASNHTERLVPTLKRRSNDMYELLRYATDSRNTIASDSVSFMQAITEVTSLRTSVKDHINILNQSEDDMTTFDYLRLIHQLPYMYASFVVEAVRRREWVDKVKTDSSTLANEMALFQDEESKRRRRWQKMVGSTYGPGLDTNVMGLEVSLLGEDNAWPLISKEHLESFLENLRAQDTDKAILDDVAQLIQELNSPTKQQSRRVKAFKNGSIHEAALGRSGLMIRGDDDLLRSLQEDKTKLENRLKTADSRVRRLEDLLHRQSQASRPGNLFQAPSGSPHERNDSSSSIRSFRPDDHRRSSDGVDPLLRKITQLENELREEKERSSRVQKDLSDRSNQHDKMKDQMQEVNSTKKDLMENMEALKREFVDERKSFEDEIKTLKARLEDTEEEIEHFGESRENEKANYDQRVQLLEAELEHVGKERQDEILKAQGQVDFLRNETRIQREQYEELERQLEAAQEESRSTSKRLSEIEPAAENYLDTLKKLHSQLAGEEPSVEDPLDLLDAVQSSATEVLARMQNMETDAALLQDNLDQATQTTKNLRDEISQANEKLSKEEIDSMHLRENLSEEKAKVKTLEQELAQGREDLSQLRSRLSDGESGSETLQKKLEEEEKKIAHLSEELAARQSQVGGLEEEVYMYKEKQESLQARLSAISKHYESRDERTKDLTQKLFSQNERMCHLLERIGYAVTRDGGEMSVSKISRSERASASQNESADPSASIRKSTTLGSRTLHESGDLDLLRWISATDPQEEEEKCEVFMKKLGDFNVDLFSDTVYHRIKEVEQKARKWQRDVRSYRERAHVLQKESNDKIAFRHFKEGDLALFLPTRNQQAGAWAAFNVGFPHYFLREQDHHRLRHREWLVARITGVQERIVDLSKNLQPGNETDSINEEENDNPFQLSDGLRWYLIDAHEDKPGAPSTPGMGKSTVAANTVEATANLHTHASSVKGKGKNRDSITSIEGINKTLSKSLESRRSSSASKKALPFAGSGGAAMLKSSAVASETNSLRAAAPETPLAASPTQGGHLADKAESSAPAASRSKSGSGEVTDNGDTKSLEPKIKLSRNDSVESPTKRSVVLDSMWSVDYSYESPSKK